MTVDFLAYFWWLVNGTFSISIEHASSNITHNIMLLKRLQSLTLLRIPF